MARRQVRGSSLLLLGNIASLAMTFVPHVFLVRYFSTESYGHLAYLLSLISVCKTYTLGFNEALSRFVPIQVAKQDHKRAIGTVVVVSAVTFFFAGLFILAFAIGSHRILSWLTQGREPGRLMLVLMFLIPLETAAALMMNLFACFGRTRIIFWGRYIVPPALRVVAICLVIFLQKGVTFLAFGYVFAELITVLPFGIALVSELRRQKLLCGFSDMVLPIREILAYSVPLMASNAVGYVGTSIPVLLLGYFHSMSTVAVYRVVLPAAALSNMIVANFMPLYMPTASRLFAKGDMEGIDHLFWRTSQWMSILAFPIFLATACFAAPITKFLYGERYLASSPVLAILSLGYFSNVIFGFNGVTLKVLGKIKVMVILNIITPLIIVLFNVLLIPHYGALGAAVGTAAGILVQNILRQIAVSVAGPVTFLDREFLSFFGILIACASCTYVLQMLAPTNIISAAALAALGSSVALWRAKKHLKIGEAFPEIARVPLFGRLLA